MSILQVAMYFQSSEEGNVVTESADRTDEDAVVGGEIQTGVTGGSSSIQRGHEASGYECAESDNKVDAENQFSNEVRISLCK